jgi:hypothetical protein
VAVWAIPNMYHNVHVNMYMYRIYHIYWL